MPSLIQGKLGSPIQYRESHVAESMAHFESK